MKRRMLGSAAVVVGAALAVAGCGAGQITQTDTQVAAINGTSAAVGDIEIRDAEIAYPESDGSGRAVYPPNSNAETTMWLVNEGTRPDELVSARSGSASNVLIEGSRTVPAQRTLVLSPEEPPLQSPTTGQLTLQGLKQQLRPGELVEITLTFRDAGSVTFEMPVTVPNEPRQDRPPVQGGH